MTQKDRHVQKQLAENPSFEVGDVVRLVAGGPTMAIRRVDGDEILCEWFDKATPRCQVFLQAQLAHTNPKQLPVITFRVGGDRKSVV
jgi:uncharacterized protein YodC (DUF2158 family)